jgi:Mg2+/Co2+ transporter CorB
MKEDNNDKKRIKFNKKRTSDKKSNRKWIVGIIIWTFVISSLISFVSDILLSRVGLLIAFFILILIIITGIAFDIIGVAVTAAEEVPFHSMASRKVKGAKTSVALIRNADKVSNFCNDVIGDICGVVSGGAGAVLIGKIITIGGIDDRHKTILTLSISAVIASMTVGGKALGKNFAITQSNNIVYSVSWFLDTLRRKK